MAKTILIVDDSATMIMSVKSTLEINGYKVETAEDGVKAMAKLTSGLKPDLTYRAKFPTQNLFDLGGDG